MRVTDRLRPRGDDRAVSTTINYVLALAVTTALITGLLIATSSVVEDRREATIRDGLEVVGQQVAADLMTADRLVEAGGTEVVVRSELPETIAGARYVVTVDAGGASPTVVLEAQGLDETVSVSVRFTATTDVVDSAATSGDVEIAYDAGADELEVREG